jgi:tRNA (adenine57-N1/adenine58-N1)-methyltransferase
VDDQTALTPTPLPRAHEHSDTPTGAELRRGLLREGDRVQLTDPRGRLHTITLAPGTAFHTHHGYLAHDLLVGVPEGTVVRNTAGIEYLALRPLLSDYVLSMPRGAAIVYPKDSAQIVAMADIFPGARVIESGVGSGALTLSLLRGVGDGGSVHSIERREDFAAIARGNVESFFGGPHPAWTLSVGDLSDVLPVVADRGSVDRVVLDMLAPWENLEAAAEALAPGGVLIAYVATTTQLSRLAEDIRSDGRYTEPQAWESMVRGWHLEGLAVRPEHRMIGHTGFLLTTRRLADGVDAPVRRRRPSKGAYPAVGSVADLGEWSAEDLGERPVSDKKARRVRRDVGQGPTED